VGETRSGGGVPVRRPESAKKKMLRTAFKGDHKPLDEKIDAGINPFGTHKKKSTEEGRKDANGVAFWRVHLLKLLETTS